MLEQLKDKVHDKVGDLITKATIIQLGAILKSVQISTETDDPAVTELYNEIMEAQRVTELPANPLS